MRIARSRVVVFVLLALLVTSTASSAMGATGITLPGRVLETVAPDYGLKAVVSDGQVVLTWSGFTVPSGKQLRGYHVYRSTSEVDVVKSANQQTELAISKTSFTDFTATGVCYYVVQAVYIDGGTALASRPLAVNTQSAASSGGAAPRSNTTPSAQMPTLDLTTPRFPSSNLPGGEVKIIDNIGSIIPKLQEPIPVAFSAVANRYTGVDPATIFDLNGDLVGDLKVSSIEVVAQNGASLQLIDPPALNLDNVHLVPAAGYADRAPVQLSRVYVMKLANGHYAKFMVLQATPKVTLWFMYGTQTNSVLEVNGADSRAVLTWDALPDAALGYNIYRYEVNDNSYTVTQLNDFTVQDTQFTDNTAANRYYLYIVQAIKAGGSPGSLTTTAAVFVTHQAHNLVVGLTADPARLDGANVPMPVKAEIKNGLLMIPASLLTHTGVKVTYEESAGKITLSRRLESVTYAVVLHIESPDYSWNGANYKTDVPPYVNGREVMVPLRVVAPVLGLGVTFNSIDRTATIGWYD